MTHIITPEEQQRERELFEAERKRVPELFVRGAMTDDDAILHSIGIEGIYGKRPIGYLKLLPQDFIVEEVSREGSVITVDLPNAEDDAVVDGEGSTYYANLVKIGISTLEAKTQIAETLGIEEKNIGYAGIKDRLALTSQAISIRGLAQPERISSIASDNFFLKNIRRGKGVVANGELKGNKFTITLRLDEPISPSLKDKIEQEVAQANQEGFWNFFYIQRFGTPRLISHLLGRLILKKDYEGVVRTFCTHTNSRELPYFSMVRKDVDEHWGDWQAIKKIVDTFPYHFHLERSFIDHLAAHPKDFLGALHTLPDQVRLWLYAYDSFLFNRKLSELIHSGNVPLSLPFVNSFNPYDWKPYQEFLAADGVQLPSPAYRDFPFIRIESRKCQTLQTIEIDKVVFKDRIAVFSFSIPKGSYATSFLMGFFTLTSGLPIVPGIMTDPVDPKEVLEKGTLDPVLERFKMVLNRRKEDLNNASIAEE